MERARSLLALIISAGMMAFVIMLDQGLSGASAMNPLFLGSYVAACLAFAVVLATGHGEERLVTWARWFAALPWLLIVGMCIYASKS